MGTDSLKCVQQAVKNVKTFLKNNLDGRYSLPKKVNKPFPCDYAPNKGVSSLLETYVAKYAADRHPEMDM